jgi:hypothetical protein
MTENLLVLAAVVLLPLVPACILYRFLPSNTIVNGPFQGLNLQLTGAFGGYFLVLLAAFGFYHTLPDNHQPETEEIWTLRGKVPALVTNSNDLQLSVRPASTQIDEDGTFTMQILVPRRQGRLQLPTLIVQHPLYETVNVHFPVPGGLPIDCKIQNDEKNRTIDIPQDCLRLTKKDEATNSIFVTRVESISER